MHKFQGIIDDNGEIITEGIHHVVTNKEQEANQAFKESAKRKYEFKVLIRDHFGTFFFYKYDEMLQYIDYDTAAAFRFLFLCTFADKEGYIQYKKDAYCIKPSDFVAMFQKTRQTVNVFLDKLIKYNLIEICGDGRYKVNPDFYATNLEDPCFKGTSVMIFCNGIRNLYYMIDTKEHNKAGELLKLIPFIHKNTNALCRDTDCPELRNAGLLTLNEINEILRPNSTYGKRLFLDIRKFKINGEYVVISITADTNLPVQYVVNPKLIYRGNNAEELTAVMRFFETYNDEPKRGQKLKQRGK